MAPLAHCIYASAAAQPLDAAALRDMLEASRANNRRLGITGMLLYADGSFFQVLEGPAAAVATLFARIAADPRHRLVTKIIDEPIVRRSFGEWSMGFPAGVDLRAVPGFDDCLGHGRCVERVEPGRARKLIAAFAAGRGRQRLTDEPPEVAAGRS